MTRKLMLVTALGFSVFAFMYGLKIINSIEKPEAKENAQALNAIPRKESRTQDSDSVAANNELDKTDSLPLVWSASYIEAHEHAESVERARELMHSGSQSQKIRAFHLLMEMSPPEAAVMLSSFIVAAKTDDDAAELVAHGLVGFSQSAEYLSEADLKNSFALNNITAQKISALILEERGDGSLVKQYMDTKALALKDKNPTTRSQALKEIASVGFSSAIPYALKSLNDADVSVKLEALELLSQYATNSNIGDIQPLVNNPNKEVSRYAQETINSLWNKNTNDVLSLAERLVQPGFPVGGMALDLELEE